MFLALYACINFQLIVLLLARFQVDACYFNIPLSLVNDQHDNKFLLQKVQVKSASCAIVVLVQHGPIFIKVSDLLAWVGLVQHDESVLQRRVHSDI